MGFPSPATRAPALALGALLFMAHRVHGQSKATPTPIGPLRGALVLDGGPEASGVVARRFVELAGGQNAKIVVIPTAGGDEFARDPATLESYRKLFGRGCCTILHAVDRAMADRPDFSASLGAATGVWISGGAPSVLSNVYWHSATQRALQGVLDRGGVVGGSSAGAIIQGSRVPTTRPERGFGFLRNTIVMPHLNRGRAREMLLAEVAAGVNLGGLGLPERTAAVITNDNVEAIGDGDVVVAGDIVGGRRSPVMLHPGDRLSLKRRVTPETRKP